MNTSKPLKTVESLINKELVKWLDGTKVPGAIVVTNDFATNLTKKLNAHYYQLMLSLLPSQSKYKTVDSYKKAIRQKLSEHFNGEGEQ